MLCITLTITLTLTLALALSSLPLPLPLSTQTLTPYSEPTRRLKRVLRQEIVRVLRGTLSYSKQKKEKNK